MNDAELFEFMDTFTSMTRVFPLRGDEHEIRDMGSSYFKAFRKISLKDIKAGAEVWLAKGTKFPKPAEWMNSIPRRQAIENLQPLTPSEAREYFQAMSRFCEDEPCHCAECVEANVEDKPRRFVPEEHSGLIGDQVVHPGRWIHGFELARWYAARQAFWNQMAAYFGVSGAKEKKNLRLTLERRMKEIYDETGKVRPRPTT